ncbi:hypothetical protein NLU13_6564 [Sarocladium strictum]|uniref:Uncharacterized protein n=1 Tax=Sarocladium strictum TaxID=5046 RepID=A0AA39GHF1_SARSR|nr:hypothetical protein NLU13_6564 [Sarocladium strictum]
MKLTIFAILAASFSTVYAVDCFCITTDDDAAAGRAPLRTFNLGGACEARGGAADINARVCKLLPEAGAFTDEFCQQQSPNRLVVANCVASTL